MMMIESRNPYTGEKISTYKYFSDREIDERVKKAGQAFISNLKDEFGRNLEARINGVERLAEYLLESKEECAAMITVEMGKPITQSRAEIEKCGWLCRYYIENAPRFLSPTHIETDASESYVRYDPLGVILAIMPWNYPFWQLFRFAVPAVLAGNTAILKHSSIVSGSALLIEELFRKAGFPESTFQTILAGSSQMERVIENPIIKGVTLTGSENAGRSVASIAGRNIKKTVLELGGSNACLVFEDADLDAHIETLVWARFQNAGQSCIAGKRFIILDGIYDDFKSAFTDKVRELTIGDPLDPETELSVMASPELAEELEEQVRKSVELGAKILYGGNRTGAAFEPTVLENVRPGMPAFDEELFGPVASIIRVESEQEAVELLNHSTFGLGASLFTKDLSKARKWIPYINEGAVFVNELVKSDPRLPFGGTKNSGYGRELSREGILEFVNRKTVYIK